MNLNKTLVLAVWPSGVWKWTVTKHIIDEYSWEKIVSDTSRKIRKWEVEWYDYRTEQNTEYFQKNITKFIDREYYNLEQEEYDLSKIKNWSNFYWLLDTEIIEKESPLLVWDLSFRWALEVLKNTKLLNIDVFIILLHAKTEIIEKRLRERNTESKEEIKRRLKDADEYKEHIKKINSWKISDKNISIIDTSDFEIEDTLEEIKKIMDKIIKK